MDIGRTIQQIKNRLAAVERSARLSHASIDNTSVQVRDGSGSLRGLVGMQADGTTAVNIVNGPPPPQPSPPIVASVLGGVTASWDGAFADGFPVPLDWARVEVHASATAVYTPTQDTLHGTIETAQGATVVVPCASPVYVLLLARSTSGTASPASATVGPVGPSPVVASDVLDGIITTVKLADDAVTQAKVATGAIGSTEISDGAVTTPKLVAGAVQAGKIAADAVQAGNIAANAVTAREIAANAVTANQIAANSVTAGKILAGAVDATALAATAITGKTITGGTVTGSLIQTASTGQRITINESSNNRIYVYDATNAVIGEFSGSGLHVKGTAGATLWVDPSAPLPQIRFDNASGTASAYLQMAEVNPGDANLQFVTGPFSADGYTDRVWRQYMGNDFAVIERIRRSSSTNNRGGRLNLRPDLAEVGYQDANTVQEPGYTSYTPGTATHRARAVVQPVQASTTAPLLTLLQPSGHTALAVRYTDSGSVDRFTVDTTGNTSVGGTLSAGATTVTGTLSVTSTTWTSWTPTVSGAGAATFSITDGWYYKLGKLVFVQAYITCSAAGSGTGTVTVVLPSTPYRGPSANRRQHLSTYFGGLAAGTNSSTSGHGAGLIQPTGSGALIDQFRGPTDILVRGENLSATATIAINGWYREA
ncbi:hypothetical protein ACWEGQ_00590 [Streptomyces seoulensis]